MGRLLTILRSPRRVAAPSPTGVNRRDLRAFQTEACHQSALPEWEGVDVLAERRAGQAAGRALVHHHDARARPDRPAVTLLQVVESRIVHEEQCVAEPLRAGLQAERGGRNVVVADGLAADPEYTV